MTENLLPQLAASVDVYVQKLDLVRDAALLMRFDERAYRDAAFLDDRVLGPATQGGWAQLDRVIEAGRAVGQSRPVHFIFHSGHVGSTLLSRLLDETNCVLSLREPLPLRTLADAHDALEQPESLIGVERFDRLRRGLLALWSRGYSTTRAVVVKATSSVGRYAAALLASAGDARAIYLNVRAESYLATLLAGQNSAIDLRGHGPVRIRSLQRRMGGAPLTPLHGLSLGELAAMSWLAEAWNEHEAAAAAPTRVLRLDFEHVLGNLRDSLARVLSHYGLPQDEQFLAGIHRSPVLSRYSKAAQFEYSPQMRLQILNQSRRDHGEEIRRGLAWLETIAKAEPMISVLLNAGSG